MPEDFSYSQQSQDLILYTQTLSWVKPGGVFPKAALPSLLPTPSHHTDSPSLSSRSVYIYNGYQEKPFPFLPLKGNTHMSSRAEFGVWNLCCSITMEFISFMCDQIAYFLTLQQDWSWKGQKFFSAWDGKKRLALKWAEFMDYREWDCFWGNKCFSYFVVSVALLGSRFRSSWQQKGQKHTANLHLFSSTHETIFLFQSPFYPQ